MTCPFVSVIIPAFNEETYIGCCLEAIWNLDYPKECVEIIVVDNGSKDKTRDIARARGAHVITDATKTVAGLRNLGARKAKGEVLAFVDADCIVSKDWLKKAAVYVARPEIAAWGAPPEIPEKSTWVQRAWHVVRRKEKEIQEADWLESMNLFVRREAFLRLGGFNETLVTCEDVDFSYRISRRGKIMSDSRIAVIHLGEASTVREFFRKEIWRGKSNLAGIRSHGISFKEMPSLILPLYFGALMPLLYSAGLVSANPTWLVAVVLLCMAPNIAVLKKVRQKKTDPKTLLQLLGLMQVYFFARTVALLKG